MKLNDFLCQKLNNFHSFLNMELLKINNIDQHIITEEHIKLFDKEINNYIHNIPLFISGIQLLDKNDIDSSIKLFLSNYKINIDDIINIINYKKLKQYIAMFIDVIQI